MKPAKPGPNGIYDLLVDSATAPALEALAAQGQATLAEVPPEGRRARLLEALQDLLPDLLEDHLQGGAADAGQDLTLSLVNQVIRQLRRDPDQAPINQWQDPLRVLTSLHRGRTPYVPPELPLSTPWLFASGHGDPSLLAELSRELASADRLDILISFITWSGVRKLWPVLEGLTALGAGGQPKVPIRILTTTYIGATEMKALEQLASLPGVEIRISLDGRRTRLHAKAWIVHRRSGYGTAFVGSANLSAAALMGGLEWTVRFTQAGQADLFGSAKAHFETLWNDPEFQPFDAKDPDQVAQVQAALSEEGRRGATTAIRTWFEIQPKAFQQDMLDRLKAERRHGRTRNLLVAATGTGKTVVAALDYRSTCQDMGGRPRLLFVAHRREILEQARETYRQVLRASDFGELLADGLEPVAFDHVFATIQSLGSRGLLARFNPDHWHTVVIDECHHIAAEAFSAFANAVRPAVLLGLTATPERADGLSILPYFDMRPDGSPAAELRLWDALDLQLLAPFEFYGVTDPTDFREVRWRQAGEQADLDRILTGDHLRARTIIDAFHRYVSNPTRAKAIGFCVSVRHAEFMADQFSRSGFKAIAVTGSSDRDLRQHIPALMAGPEGVLVFTCDLYNEGVDLPEVDTILLLRPTQSPVLFQQQIGRGLRLSPNKASCLVLDFVGQHREEFRFDRLLAGLTGQTRRHLTEAMEAGFPSLPPGCHIQFERIAGERVLDNLRAVAAQNWRRLTAELRAYCLLPGRGRPRLAAFLQEQELAIEDLYRNAIPSGWAALQRAAHIDPGPEGQRDGWLGRRFGDLLHADDPGYLRLWQKVASPDCSAAVLSAEERRLAQMLAYQVFPDPRDRFGVETFLGRLREAPAMAAELMELGSWLDEGSSIDPKPIPGAPQEWPLRLHAAYELREILTAVGQCDESRRPLFRQGVLALHDQRMELLFVTLDKREGFHAAVAYHDYAISPDRFHWQTQNSAGPTTSAGRRYLESHQNGWRFQLFVRADKASPYRALGPATLIDWEGEKPMSITWGLEVPMPMGLFQAFSVLRAG